MVHCIVAQDVPTNGGAPPDLVGTRPTRRYATAGSTPAVLSTVASETRMGRSEYIGCICAHVIMFPIPCRRYNNLCYGTGLET